LNDNVIDLQIKRSVLRAGTQRKQTTAAIAAGAAAAAVIVSSSAVASTSPPQNQKPELKLDAAQEKDKQSPPEEVKINKASPHNTSPVYAFSCMFYTKLTENCRIGNVTRTVSTCL
jgi:hypothetical protein